MHAASPRDSNQCQFSITAAPEVLEHVRCRIRTQLCRWGLLNLADVAELGVTELLANVCRHVEDKRCRVSLAHTADVLRIEVHDSDPRIPAPRVVHEWEESGRGLLLLSRMADAWGGTALDSGKAMWFELAAKP